MFKLPAVEKLVADEKEFEQLKEKCIRYDLKNRPTSRVKKTYVEACEQSNINPELETVIKPTETDYLRFLKANKHLELIDGVVVEKSIHGQDDDSSEFQMPPPNSLLMDN